MIRRSVRQTAKFLSNSMLILSEADTRRCFTVPDAIATTRKALASLVKDGGGDPDKKTKADTDIKNLQSLVQLAQKPVSNKDSAGFGVIAAKADSLFGEFFDLLSDIPDEL